ncbi:MAG: hypothetical protein ACUVTQ_10445 [Desulfotomaculales bacterium]
MLEWVDVHTGRKYRLTAEGLRKARAHVAGMLARALAGKAGVREMADGGAEFWVRKYYELVFPLGFGRVAEGGAVRGCVLPSGPEVEVDRGAEFRREPLDGTALPPVLPAGGEAQAEVLLADLTLVRTAFINVLLRQRGLEGELLDRLRLACLTAPLWEELRACGVGLPREVEPLVAFLRGSGGPPVGLDGNLVRVVWEAVESPGAAGKLTEDLCVTLVVGVVARVKQYVFETPGLNEIRGGSELLEKVTRELGGRVAGELGPEVVLRAAGSHLEFLAPAGRAADGEEWAARVRKAFVEATGGVPVTAVAVSLKVRDLLCDFSGAMAEVHRELEAARSRAVPGQVETLPFEERCAICRRRAAEGWFVTPEGVPEPACRRCITKREVGRAARWEKTRELAELLGPDADPWGLQRGTRYPQSLDDLVPRDRRRRLVALVYGDGNNFGAVAQRQRSLAEAVQWTRRVASVTRSAAALALAEAATGSADGTRREDLSAQEFLPFQVLALGGEDVSLFAWGPVGLRFAQRFVELTDREFEPAVEAAGKERICFSLGVLVTDEKAPVRRTVDFAEEELLKWAKRAARNARYRHGGTVAFLVVPSVGQIPGDLEAYRRQMYLRRGRTFDLCLTLRPVTAAELDFLLQKAARLQEEGHTGHVERLAAAFVRGKPRVAVLYYLYQKARERKEAAGAGFTSVLEEASGAPPALGDLAYPTGVLPGRVPFGEEAVPGQKVLFSPLADLAELIKVWQ